ncbi:flagellin [Alsobacter soli]|uniref:Flagellin n=1 Tax=Alsobacter soli TaxID=2109933 RepID=A0A2T1HUB8_9HYPH|nr:flagellin [Alsobacter soli]PSC05218.1 flagellin [Alsobacter soli]
MAVAISTGVRNALSALQTVQSAMQTSQSRLATGKKVNSAVDNAVNFFTAAGLNDRSSQLSGLLDGMSNAVQTINAASKGLDSITKLVQSAQSTIKQAQAESLTKPAITGATALATSAEATATGQSIKATALAKNLLDDNTTATANTATSSYAGNLGIDPTKTSLELNVTVGNQTYTDTSLSATSTLSDLVDSINSSGIASASVDDTGKLVVTASSGDKVTVGLGAGTTAALAHTDAVAGGQNTAVGLIAADATTGASPTSSAVRTNLIKQYNDLRDQIDQLAKDAGFNGTNLLAGDKMSVVFNEKTGSSQSKLSVQGQTIDSSGLGLSKAAGATGAGQVNFQSDSELSGAADSLTNALSSLRSFSSTLGSNLAVVQARQDFTKSMIDTLNTGADNLVNADQNQEAATLLALQTRQQLSQTALSLSNQADQGVLRLF